MRPRAGRTRSARLTGAPGAFDSDETPRGSPFRVSTAETPDRRTEPSLSKEPRCTSPSRSRQPRPGGGGNVATRTIDGCDTASVLIIEDRAASTAAAASPLAAEVDRLQIDADEGPCIDASNGGTAFYADDLATDTRWPTFGPDAVGANIRSILAYPISTERLSALNLYAHLPAAFGATDRAQGQLFATLARLALDQAHERADDRSRSIHLHEALRTRELIGQAQGILMERERINGEQAFDVLRRASQHMNLKLRDVAQSLVDTGEMPNDA
jgi:GAF domain-containing protein